MKNIDFYNYNHHSFLHCFSASFSTVKIASENRENRENRLSDLTGTLIEFRSQNENEENESTYQYLQIVFDNV